MGIFDGYLLVSDMDGTLLNKKGNDRRKIKEAIRISLLIMEVILL